MHLYWSYPQGRNYATVDNIFKFMNLNFFSHLALFGSFGMHAKDTDYIFGTPYTQIHTRTNTDTHLHVCTQKYTHKCACGKSMDDVTSNPVVKPH